MKRGKLVLLIGAIIIITLIGCGEDEATAAVETLTSAEEDKEEEIPVIEEERIEVEVPKTFDNLITVGIVNNNPDESAYRSAIDKDLKDTFTEENGYSTSFVYGMNNDEQITAAQKFIQDGVDYLLLSAVDSTGWDSVLMNAQDAGVRVILFDRTINTDESLYETSIVSDMNKEGEAAVAWLEKQDLDSYNIIHLQGVMGSAAQKGRTDALNAKVAADAEWTFVTQKTANWNEDNAQQIVQSVIDSKEAFNVIYAENDDMAKGAVAALDNAGISHGVGGNVIIVSFECNKWALEELLAQNWNYDGQHNPFQAFYIDQVIKIMESGGTVAEKVIVMDEDGFDATTITAEDIVVSGI